MKTPKSIATFPWVGLKIWAPFVFLLLAGCGGGGASTTEEDQSVTPASLTPTIAGGFTDAQNTVVEISATTIVLNTINNNVGSTATYHVEKIVMGEFVPTGYIISRNDAGNSVNPDLYSVFDWTSQGTNLFLCHSASDKASIDDAETVPVPDDSNPSASGCGGGAWVQITRNPLPIRGNFEEVYPSFSISHSISQSLWDQGFGKYHIIEIDSPQNFLLALNDANTGLISGLYSRFDWTINNDVLYYCQTVYDGNTPTDARNATPPVTTDPANGGCGPFSWSPLGSPVAIFANRVLDYSPVNSLGTSKGDWPQFYQPEAILGPPGDLYNVVSLGYDPTARAAQGGSVSVGLGVTDKSGQAVCVVDGPGTDLIVFENTFRLVVGNPETYNEVATVEVSDNGLRWFPFPWQIDENNIDLSDPARYTNFAGVIPVAEGGDSFDLGDVILANPGVLDANFRACFIRARDGGTLIDDYGNSQSDLYNSGADLNAVQAIYFETVIGLPQ